MPGNAPPPDSPISRSSENPWADWRGELGEPGGRIDHRRYRPKSLKPAGSHTLWIGDIAIDVSEQDLFDLFESCGEIEMICLQINKLGNGQFGHIRFCESETVDKAVNLFGRMMKGSAIRLDFAEDRPVSAWQKSRVVGLAEEAMKAREAEQAKPRRPHRRRWLQVLDHPGRRCAPGRRGDQRLSGSSCSCLRRPSRNCCATSHPATSAGGSLSDVRAPVGKDVAPGFRVSRTGPCHALLRPALDFGILRCCCFCIPLCHGAGLSGCQWLKACDSQHFSSGGK